MAEPQNASPSWTTWEELLLACAVHRHGTAAWDSVAAEIRKRTAAVAVNSVNCQQKYLDLKIRYGHKTSGSDTVPWLDELKSTRVQELKQEVQRCDLSIVSLQLKVQKLKEERESGQNSDPEKGEAKIDKTGEKAVEPEQVEPGSCNGSSDSVERKPVVELVKESSDLQSSAGESDKVQSEEDGDLAVERRGVGGSEPLVGVLEMVRAHKGGSAFEGRLMMQQAGEHRNSIRQHIDIETIHTRLAEGCYSDCNKKFFRDLLLLFNNATLSFGKISPEFAAAVELRQLISREMYQRIKKSDSSTLSLSSKPDPEPSDSLVLEPKILRPIIVCRKRSSIASKVSGSSSGEEKKKVHNAALLEDKPLLDWKQLNKSSANADETENTKKRTSNRFFTSSKSSKKNWKNHTSPNQNKSTEPQSIQNQAKGSSPKEHIEPKTNKNSPNVMGVRKRNVSSGNKNKQKSSTLHESLKDSEISPNNGKGGAEIKTSNGSNGRGERKREQRDRQVKERESPIKKNNGRAGKRRAAAPSLPLAVSDKRSREGGDADVAASSQPKKRSRR